VSKWGKKAPTWQESDPLELWRGWTAIWEAGRYLGLIDRSDKGLARLEAFIQARPSREFHVQFVQRPAGCQFAFLRPIGSFLVIAGERNPMYFPLDQEPRKGE
jgi:hypothetical protein